MLLWKNDQSNVRGFSIFIYTYLYTFTNSRWPSKMIKKTQKWWICMKD